MPTIYHTRQNHNSEKCIAKGADVVNMQNLGNPAYMGNSFIKNKSSKLRKINATHLKKPTCKHYKVEDAYGPYYESHKLGSAVSYTKISFKDINQKVIYIFADDAKNPDSSCGPVNNNSGYIDLYDILNDFVYRTNTQSDLYVMSPYIHRNINKNKRNKQIKPKDFAILREKYYKSIPQQSNKVKQFLEKFDKCFSERVESRKQCPTQFVRFHYTDINFEDNLDAVISLKYLLYDMLQTNKSIKEYLINDILMQQFNIRIEMWKIILSSIHNLDTFFLSFMNDNDFYTTINNLFANEGIMTLFTQYSLKAKKHILSEQMSKIAAHDFNLYMCIMHFFRGKQIAMTPVHAINKLLNGLNANPIGKNTLKDLYTLIDNISKNLSDMYLISRLCMEYLHPHIGYFGIVLVNKEQATLYNEFFTYVDAVYPHISGMPRIRRNIKAKPSNNKKYRCVEVKAGDPPIRPFF